MTLCCEGRICYHYKTDCEFSFFFSSRRRHTRFDCDWSSDVCSSDLPQMGGMLISRSHRSRLWQFPLARERSGAAPSQQTLRFYLRSMDSSEVLSLQWHQNTWAICEGSLELNRPSLWWCT